MYLERKDFLEYSSVLVAKVSFLMSWDIQIYVILQVLAAVFCDKIEFSCWAIKSILLMKECSVTTLILLKVC